MFLKCHILKYKNINALLKYNCEKCSNGTNNKTSLKKLVVKPKSITELPKYNCDKVFMRQIIKCLSKDIYNH